MRSVKNFDSLAVKSLIVMLSLLFSSNTLSRSIYAPYSYGELHDRDYFGIKGNRNAKEFGFNSGVFFDYESIGGKSTLTSDKSAQDYLLSHTSYGLLSFRDYLADLSAALVCPNDFISEHYHYYRFLYRLISISYLFEALKIYKLESQKLGFNNTCNINLQKILHKCSPKSEDMKFFISNAIEYVKKNTQKNDISFVHNIPNYRSSWREKSEVLLSRVQYFCFENKDKCPLRSNDGVSISANELKQTLHSICDTDLRTLKHFCDEKAHMTGPTNSIYAYHLLKNSQALLAINKEGYANGCLKRFSLMARSTSQSASSLVHIFGPIYEYLNEKSNLLPSTNTFEKKGELFKIGSLKRFRDQGLNNLFKKKEVSLAKVIDVPKAEKKIFKGALAPSALAPFKKKRRKRKQKKAQSLKVSSVVDEIPLFKSAFLKASIERSHNDFNKVQVAMDDFKFDYIFTKKMKKTLENALGKYTSRDGLAEMKSLDHLGSKKGPVPLRFIKYLIDTENHTGLYNIKSVLGGPFYVMNDIDTELFKRKKSHLSDFKIQLVEMENNRSTQYQWQLFILKYRSDHTTRP